MQKKISYIHELAVLKALRDSLMRLNIENPELMLFNQILLASEAITSLQNKS